MRDSAIPACSGSIDIIDVALIASHNIASMHASVQGFRSHSAEAAPLRLLPSVGQALLAVKPIPETYGVSFEQLIGMSLYTIVSGEPVFWGVGGVGGQ